MAAKPKDQPIPADASAEKEIPIDEVEERLEEFREKFSTQEYAIVVERQSAKTREYEICEKVTVEEFSPYTFRDEWGPGRYRCTLLNNGRYVNGGRMYWRFAEPPLKKESTPKSFLEDPMVQFMIAQQKETTAMIMQMIQSLSPKTSSDTNLTQLVEAMHKMKTLNPGEKSTSMAETIDMIANIRELFPSDEGGGGGKTGIVSELMEALKVMGTLRGLGPEGGVPKLSNYPQPPRTVVTNAPTLVGTGSVRMIKTPEAKPLMTESVEKIMFYLPRFVEAARAGRTPDQTASYLIEVLNMEIVPALVRQYAPFATDDVIWDKLIAAASDPEETQKIYAFAPDLKEHEAWVTDVLNAAVVLIAEPGDEIIEAGPAELTTPVIELEPTAEVLPAEPPITETPHKNGRQNQATKVAAAKKAVEKDGDKS